jgi:ABC-type phosphate transport system auxiliary subunit
MIGSALNATSSVAYAWSAAAVVGSSCLASIVVFIVVPHAGRRSSWPADRGCIPAVTTLRTVASTVLRAGAQPTTQIRHSGPSSPERCA